MKIFNWECEINVCRMQPAGEMSSAKRYAAWRVLTDRELRNATGYVVWPEAKNWQVGIYGKYRFTFGPTHTPRARAAREKKEKAPKVRDGKVNVKVY